MQHYTSDNSNASLPGSQLHFRGPGQAPKNSGPKALCGRFLRSIAKRRFKPTSIHRLFHLRVARHEPASSCRTSAVAGAVSPTAACSSIKAACQETCAAAVSPRAFCTMPCATSALPSHSLSAKAAMAPRLTDSACRVRLRSIELTEPLLGARQQSHGANADAVPVACRIGPAWRLCPRRSDLSNEAAAAPHPRSSNPAEPRESPP